MLNSCWLRPLVCSHLWGFHSFRAGHMYFSRLTALAQYVRCAHRRMRHTARVSQDPGSQGSQQPEARGQATPA